MAEYERAVVNVEEDWTPSGPMPNTITLDVCQECGGYVGNVGIHDAWHASHADIRSVGWP